MMLTSPSVLPNPRPTSVPLVGSPSRISQPIISGFAESINPNAPIWPQQIGVHGNACAGTWNDPMAARWLMPVNEVNELSGIEYGPGKIWLMLTGTQSGW